MNTEKEMTAPVASVGADAEQSSQKTYVNSISDVYAEINGDFLRGGGVNG